MKKIFVVLLLLSCVFMSYTQDTVSFITKEYYVNDFIHYKNDSFLVVNKTTEYKSDLMISESTNAYLFGLKNDNIQELVLSEHNLFDEYEGIEVENTMRDYAQDFIYNSQGSLDENDFMNGMLFEFYSTNKITQIKYNVVEVSYFYWSFEGGAHGNGWANYLYYDLENQAYFILEDVIVESGFNFIYEEVKKDFFGEDTDQDLLKELDDKTADNRKLKSTEYYFTETGLNIEIQMYQSLYDVEDFYIGYNNWEMEIPYEKLSAYMIPDSPIDRMLKE